MGKSWKGKWRRIHLGGYTFLALFHPISSLNAFFFLARATCQMKGTENIFVLSGLFVTAV